MAGHSYWKEIQMCMMMPLSFLIHDWNSLSQGTHIRKNTASTRLHNIHTSLCQGWKQSCTQSLHTFLRKNSASYRLNLEPEQMNLAFLERWERTSQSRKHRIGQSCRNLCADYTGYIHTWMSCNRCTRYSAKLVSLHKLGRWQFLLSWFR